LRRSDLPLGRVFGPPSRTRMVGHFDKRESRFDPATVAGEYPSVSGLGEAHPCLWPWRCPGAMLPLRSIVGFGG
jgi:hypothetical protein